MGSTWPAFDRLEPIDLSSLPPTNDASLRSSDFTFSHFFDQSSSYDSSVASAMSTISSQEPDIGALSRWIGWTWEPPPSLVKPPPPTDILSKVTSNPPRPVADFVTPKRSSVSQMYPHGRLSTVRRPVPGSHARARPISERQAFSELVDCVQKSAQKQLSARSATAWSRKSLLSKSRSPIPPTPTPLSRDTSKVVHHQLSKTGDRAPTISHCTEMHLMINDKLHDLHLRLQNIRQIMDHNDRDP
ncbi:hypothetical protein I203_102703 [Kwoniella mangroviensis CBS 8507]|uniref:uncharacterized protein n=1 Tax=Kwoniella mangroviensis CBS 8507 TaxID=1296122 RepID=UPI0030302718